MIKKLFFCFLLFGIRAGAQVLVNVQLPPGVVQKPQLWNLTITNPGRSSIPLHIEMLMTDAANGQEVLHATTRTLTVATGTTLLNGSLVAPVQYQVLSAATGVDAGANGLLPVGRFRVCYSIWVEREVKEKTSVEDCQELLVEPLSPPQLIAPANGTVVESNHLQFNWMPPAPLNLFAGLSYDFQLVEVYPTQTAAGAILQNIPVYRQHRVSSTALPYPAAAAKLEFNKQYAWCVTAKSGAADAGRSDVWSFRMQGPQQSELSANDKLSFVKLRMAPDDGYTFFAGELKFDYLNETTDTAWNIAVYDLSANRKHILLNMDSLPLRPGHNLITYPVKNKPGFINKHRYLLEVLNSRNEIWRLQFEITADANEKNDVMILDD